MCERKEGKMNRIVEYIIRVDEVKLNGHPIQKIEHNFELAAAVMDALHEKYPAHTVRMFQVIEEEIKSFKGVRIEKIPLCPRGHAGEVDGRKIVKWTARGLVSCMICGYLGEGA